MCPSHECERLRHQTEIRQPVLLPGVHPGRVSKTLLPIPTVTLTLVDWAPAPPGQTSGSSLLCPCCVFAGPGFGGSRRGALPCAVSGVRLTNPNTGLSLSPSLKRTTDVMFGGKQVVVCGYGEVSFLSGRRWSCESASPRAILPLH